MSEVDFERFMKRVAAEAAQASWPAEAESAASTTIWWRAELRRRILEQARVTRPLRIAERAASVLCVAAAAVVGAHLGVAGVTPFIVVTLVAGAGAAAFVLRGTAE